MGGCIDMCLKGLFVLFNLGALIIGLGLMTAGAVLLHANNLPLLDNVAKVAAFVSHQIYLDSACYILIAVGIIMMVTVFCGCCGALKSDVCCVSLFFIMLSVCVAVQMILAVIALLGWLRIEPSIDTNAYCTFKYCDPDVPKEDSQPFVEALSFFQAQLQCCGVHNVTDYYLPNVMMETQGKLPWHCCVLTHPDEDYGVLTHEKEKNQQDFLKNYIVDFENCKDMISDFNVKGCRGQVKEWMGTHVIPLAAVCIAILLFEVLLIFMAGCLCCRERKKGRDKKVEE